MFLETPRFPDDISQKSMFGPGYSTTVVAIRSGAEVRNVNWSYPRHRGDVAYGVRTYNDIEALVEFFHSVAGRGHGFRFKDWLDFKSCALVATIDFDDQVIGTGDGIETDFQLIKTYTKGALSQVRQIKKPITGTVRIGINGAEQLSGWTVDTTTGVVSFSVAPGDTLPVTAGYEFDVPVRFDTDELNIVLEDYNRGDTSAAIIEIKDPD